MKRRVGEFITKRMEEALRSGPFLREIQQLVENAKQQIRIAVQKDMEQEKYKILAEVRKKQVCVCVCFV